MSMYTSKPELEQTLYTAQEKNRLLEKKLQQLQAREKKRMNKEASKLARAFGWACGFIMFCAALVVAGVVVKWLYTQMSQPMDIIVTSVAVGLGAFIMRGVALGKLDL